MVSFSVVTTARAYIPRCDQSHRTLRPRAAMKSEAWAFVAGVAVFSTSMPRVQSPPNRPLAAAMAMPGSGEPGVATPKPVLKSSGLSSMVSRWGGAVM